MWLFHHHKNNEYPKNQLLSLSILKWLHYCLQKKSQGNRRGRKGRVSELHIECAQNGEFLDFRNRSLWLRCLSIFEPRLKIKKCPRIQVYYLWSRTWKNFNHPIANLAEKLEWLSLLIDFLMCWCRETMQFQFQLQEKIISRTYWVRLKL